MALINCRECGREISSEAHTCPHCGCPQQAGGAYYVNPRKKRIRKFLISIASVMALLALMLASNPSEAKHQEVALQLNDEVVSQVAGKTDAFFLDDISNFVSQHLIGPVVLQFLHVDSYGICSVGRIKVPASDKSYPITFGIFGKVFPLASGEEIYHKLFDKNIEEKTEKSSSNEEEDNDNGAKTFQIQGSKDTE